MTPPPPTDEDQDALAAQWLVRVLSAEVTDADLVALTAWLEASPGHLAAYERAEAVWEEASRLSPQDAPAAPVIGLAARWPARRNASRMWLFGGAAAACIAAAAVLLVPHPKRPAPAWQSYRTAKGERRTIALADGSRLLLNSDTTVRTDISGGQRRFELSHGEVALAVTHDPAHPLSLTAGDVTVRDIGTRFDVYRDADKVRVTVSEGQVAVVSGAESAVDLTAGKQAGYDKAHGLGPAAVADLDSDLAWQDGRAVYRDVPLAAVVADLNRYVDKPLAVHGAMGQLKVNAVLSLDSETKIVEALEAFLPVRAVDTADRIELRQK